MLMAGGEAQGLPFRRAEGATALSVRPTGGVVEREGMGKRRDRTRHVIQKLLIVLLGIVSTVWAEPPSRSIFQQVKKTEEVAKVEAPPSALHLPRPVLFNALQIPEQHGRIIDAYEGNSDKTIIHIQDAHVHYEAQKNLASILESLIRNNQLKLVLVEGGKRRGELSSFRKLASKKAREEVAERYLKKGLLSGDEYLELVSDYPMIRQGIEDPELYKENFRTFMEVEKFKKNALENVEGIRRVVETLKQNIYNPSLRELERKREAYDAEQMELVEYYQYLASLKSPEGTPNVERLLKASAIEKEIDFEKVDDERDAIMKTLTEKLSDLEMESFVDQSLAFKEGTLSQKEYYEALKTLATQKEVSLKEAQNLEKYVTYLSLYSDIHHSELFKEGDRLEEAIRETLVRSEDERQLVSIAKHLKLLSNLLQLKISPDDYTTYHENRLRFSVKTFLPFLEIKSVEHRLAVSLPEGSAEIDSHMKALDHFYDVAQERDIAFVENSLKQMDKEHVRFAVLITGGFHTPGLTQILKDKKTSYIVISPRITEAGNPELYYSVVRQRSEGLVE